MTRFRSELINRGVHTLLDLVQDRFFTGVERERSTDLNAAFVTTLYLLNKWQQC